MAEEDQTRKERSTTAYHEAGHAVAHIRLGIPFRRVTIKEDGDSLGRVSGYGLGRKVFERTQAGVPTAQDRDRLEKEIICILSGPFAERRFTRKWNHAKASADHENVSMYALKLCGSEREANAYVRWLEIHTKDLLDASFIWNSVKSVAQALLERETLGAEDVRRIYLDTSATALAKIGSKTAPTGPKQVDSIGTDGFRCVSRTP